MPKIDDMYAWVIADTDSDDEGIPAFMSGGVWYPCVGADKDRVESLRPFAEQTARDQGKPIKLLHFKDVELVEVIYPDGKIAKDLFDVAEIVMEDFPHRQYEGEM